ncbi:hypothetical protein HMPREF1092_01646 [Clostridium thermobutyricum]|uniref:Uncharacterized protein n=1 Tax=Clostridium thermobutyricum TaxID=29372 RepID=N9WH44_9CLOT|nr:hypothetical protein [Clostridium thermobutyricum]ENZ02411.1 hypothetical protein HMPREF1092_01646 [Clostridium thermobutyricum]
MEAAIEFVPVVLTLLLGVVIGAGIGIAIRNFSNKKNKNNKKIRIKK